MIKNKVSIIVPIYNAEECLERCIESVINQTYRDLEIILVNDGSTDNSIYICKSYASLDNRIVVLDKKNTGVSSARNTGLSAAKGEYIQFVDSDDFIDLNMVEVLVENMKMSNSDIVFCGLKKKLKNKTTLIKFKNHGSYHIRNFIEDNIEIISDILIGSPCNKIYKSEIIKRYNIKFKNDLEYAEDLIFNYNYLINIKKVFVIEDCLYNYTRYSNNSLSSKFREDCYENLNYVYDETISLLNKFNIEKHKINNRFANIYIALVNHLYREDSTLNQEEKIRIIKKEFKDKNKYKLLNESKLTKYYYIIWFFIKKENYKLLGLFFYFKNKIRKNKFVCFIYNNISFLIGGNNE